MWRKIHFIRSHIFNDFQDNALFASDSSICWKSYIPQKATKNFYISYKLQRMRGVKSYDIRIRHQKTWDE